MAQAEIPTSFICSTNCGGCDNLQPGGSGLSRACSLFSEIDLHNDGDADTDDIFEVCPDLTLTTSST